MSKRPPEQYLDIRELKVLLENARRIGNVEWIERAERRIEELRRIGDDDLSMRFLAIMKIYEEFLTEKNGRKTRASYTWRKVANLGLRQALADWALSKQAASGFTQLVDDDKIEHTAEHLVVSFPDQFQRNVVEAAQLRLNMAKAQRKAPPRIS